MSNNLGIILAGSLKSSADNVLKNWNDIDHKNYSSPFKYFICELKSNDNQWNETPHYIIKFIEYIESLYKNKKDESIKIINNEDIFLEKIETYLKDSINDFFYCNKKEEVIFDF